MFLAGLESLAFGWHEAVQPIHDLLSRIRWDDDFGKGRFEIGYEDHQRPKPVRGALEEIQSCINGLKHLSQTQINPHQ